SMPGEPGLDLLLLVLGARRLEPRAGLTRELDGTGAVTAAVPQRRGQEETDLAQVERISLPLLQQGDGALRGRDGLRGTAELGESARDPAQGERQVRIAGAQSLLENRQRLAVGLQGLGRLILQEQDLSDVDEHLAHIEVFGIAGLEDV